MSDTKYEDPSLDEIMAGNASTPENDALEDEILDEVDPPPKKKGGMKNKILLGVGGLMVALAAVVYQSAQQKQANAEQTPPPAPTQPQEAVPNVPPAGSAASDPLGMAPTSDVGAGQAPVAAATPSGGDPFAQPANTTAAPVAASAPAATPAEKPVAPVQEQPLAEAKMPAREPVKSEPVKAEKPAKVENVKDVAPVAEYTEQPVQHVAKKRHTRKIKSDVVATVKQDAPKTDFYIPNKASTSVILPTKVPAVEQPRNLLPTNSTPGVAEQPLGWTPLN